jgi:hypothetical protein
MSSSSSSAAKREKTSPPNPPDEGSVVVVRDKKQRESEAPVIEEGDGGIVVGSSTALVLFTTGREGELLETESESIEALKRFYTLRDIVDRFHATCEKHKVFGSMTTKEVMRSLEKSTYNEEFRRYAIFLIKELKCDDPHQRAYNIACLNFHVNTDSVFLTPRFSPEDRALSVQDKKKKYLEGLSTVSKRSESSWHFLDKVCESMPKDHRDVYFNTRSEDLVEVYDYIVCLMVNETLEEVLGKEVS